MNNVKLISFTFLTLLLTIHAFSATLGEQILQKYDELQTLTKDVTALVDIVQQDSEQGPKVMQSKYYARNLSDEFLIVMTKPESEKGNGYLKSGKNFWMYRRNTRTFQHINRDENIAGTDANAGDFEASKYTELYAVKKTEKGNEQIAKETLGKIPVYACELIAIVPDVDYPEKRIWVRQDNFLPLKEQSFSSSGTLMSTRYSLNYQVVDGRYIPVKQMIVDEFEKGNKTLVEVKDIVFSAIPKQVFTKAYLENLSK